MLGTRRFSASDPNLDAFKAPEDLHRKFSLDPSSTMQMPVQNPFDFCKVQNLLAPEQRSESGECLAENSPLKPMGTLIRFHSPMGLVPSAPQGVSLANTLKLLRKSSEQIGSTSAFKPFQKTADNTTSPSLQYQTHLGGLMRMSPKPLG